MYTLIEQQNCEGPQNKKPDGIKHNIQLSIC